MTRAKADPIAGPSFSEADSALSPREVGSRLAQGPFERLGRGRWSVPAVAYMSLVPRGEAVLYVVDAGWVVEKAPARASVSEDDEDPIFAAKPGLARAGRKGRAA